MAEYVTKEKVLAQLERCARDPYHESHYIRDAAVNTIRRMEAADVVPVVRCKDCKNYAFADNRVPQERVWLCYYWGYEIGADDFCSMGERKDND